MEEWMQQEQRVLKALLDELITSVPKKQAVAVVERVAHLESINSIGIAFFRYIGNLSWQKPIIIQTIIPVNSLQKLHTLT